MRVTWRLQFADEETEAWGCASCTGSRLGADLGRSPSWLEAACPGLRVSLWGGGPAGLRFHFKSRGGQPWNQEKQCRRQTLKWSQERPVLLAEGQPLAPPQALGHLHYGSQSRVTWEGTSRPASHTLERPWTGAWASRGWEGGDAESALGLPDGTRP